jgi:hypothetical protein
MKWLDGEWAGGGGVVGASRDEHVEPCDVLFDHTPVDAGQPRLVGGVDPATAEAHERRASG